MPAPERQVLYGLYGAAGLLVVLDRRVLLQLRSPLVLHPHTWSIPGGARLKGESAEDAAFREAQEEAGIAREVVRVRGCHTLQHRHWSYVTVIAEAAVEFDTSRNSEVSAHDWVAIDEVEDLPLHPGFAASWHEVAMLL